MFASACVPTAYQSILGRWGFVAQGAPEIMRIRERRSEFEYVGLRLRAVLMRFLVRHRVNPIIGCIIYVFKWFSTSLRADHVTFKVHM